MIPASRPRNYLQAALYVVICGVIVTMLVDRLLDYAEIAERAAMEATVARLNNALYARLAYLALRGDYEAIEALASNSPFTSTEAKSPAYLGEFPSSPIDVGPGTWHYDRATNELVYVPRFARRFHSAGGARADAARYAVELRKASRYAYTGVALRPSGGWHWDAGP